MNISGGRRIEMKSNIVIITLGELLPTAMDRCSDGYRLAQICSAYIDSKYELSYTFAKDYDMVTYRIIADRETQIPSITPVYEGAFLYENEMKELFGVNMEHIDVDFKNKLYRINEEAPFIHEGDK